MSFIGRIERIVVLIGEVPSELGVSPVDALADLFKAGVDRTAQMYVGGYRIRKALGFDGAHAQDKTLRETREIAELLTGLVSGTIKLSPAIIIILDEFLESLPQETRDALAVQLLGKTAHTAARVAVIRQLKLAAADRLAGLITRTIRSTFGKEIALSAGAVNTGVGAPMAFLNLSGIAQKAAWGTEQLLLDSPRIYRLFRPHKHEYLYFLIEPFVGDLVRYTNPRHRAKLHDKHIRQRIEKVFDITLPNPG